MISVIIPTYNRADKILNSINSVLNQTIKDIEIIIVDDGSEDETHNIVKKIKDDRVRYIKHTKNMGVSTARNTGIKYAKGEYIAFQDSDEIWYKNKLEIELLALSKNKADVVFCKMNLIAKDNSKQEIPVEYKSGFIRGDVYGIGTPSWLGKTSVFKRCKFDKRFPRYADLELLLRISMNGYRIFCCDKVLMDTHMDSDLKTISGNPHKLLKAGQLLNKKYPNLHLSYFETCRKITHQLFLESYRPELSKKEVKKMRLVGREICPSIKTDVKYFLASINLFVFVDKLISK